jgi:hypothetical protein
MFTHWLPWLRCETKTLKCRSSRSRRPARKSLQLEKLETRTVPGFLPPVSYTFSDAPVQPVIADFDHDGTPDIAVTVSRGSGQSGYIAIYLGDGNGGFKPAGTYPVGTFTVGDLRAVDLTGNGNVDLVATNWYDSNVSVLLGHGDGTFAPALTFATGFDPRHLAIADFNGDGIPDLAVSDVGNGGPGNAGVSVLLGNGDGTFQPARHYAVGGDITGLVAGHLRGNGSNDIALTNRSGSVASVLLNDGDGTFQLPVSYPVGNDPFGVTLVDLNGDGNLDIVTANVGDHSLSVLLGNGDGTFAPRVDYSTGRSTPEYPVSGDFNGDGIPDIAVTSSTDSGIGVLLGDGGGGLVAMRAFAASGNPAGVAVGDLNGDGFPDVVITTFRTTSQRYTMDVLLNDGNWDPSAPGHGGGEISRAIAAALAKPPDTLEVQKTPGRWTNTDALWTRNDEATQMTVTDTIGMPAASAAPIFLGWRAPAPFELDVVEDLCAI